MNDEQRALVWRELRQLDGLTKVALSLTEARYHLEQIAAAERPETIQDLLRLQGLFSALVMAYMRPFAKANDATNLDASIYPAQLKIIHERLKNFRNQRFAHNDAHATVDRELRIEADSEGFLVVPELSFSLPYGSQGDFEAIVVFLDAYLHERVNNLTAKMSEKLGVRVRYPSGPSPSWANARASIAGS